MFGHPRDPFSRIDVRRTSRPVRIEVDGEVLAETTNARLLFETGIHTRFYLPKEDVRGELVPSARRSYCPYKGEASYWSVGPHEDIAWSYEHPLPDGPLIAGLVAFWDEKVEVYLDLPAAWGSDERGRRRDARRVRGLNPLGLSSRDSEVGSGATTGG